MSTEKEHIVGEDASRRRAKALAVRHFRRSGDIEWLERWYKHYGFDVSGDWTGILPKNGAVVLVDGEPAFTAFLYRTDSSVSYLDNAIKKPGIPMDVLYAESTIRFLLAFAPGPVVAFTKYPSLQVSLRNSGFRQDGQFFMRG